MSRDKMTTTSVHLNDHSQCVCVCNSVSVFARLQQRQVQQFMLCRRSRRFTDSVPTVQTVQKTEEISQVRFLDKVVEMTVVVQHQVSMVQVVQKTAWKKSTGGQLQDELQGECKQLQLSADSSRKQITMCS